MYDNGYYVEGLKYNLLSVSQLNSLGYKVESDSKKENICDTDGKIIGN